ncbi:hypothetical protein [Paenibacillus sp. LHD-38]|uniref:hypothetical protein n=1 Tax=Paenibacillus sp. LHD-38 TaxID=3072143 RepID=UPI00280D9B0C|nr:hypothetical protein [Paenibacillus sp. LHD-38]MDQ8739335.1 hypothetical protein [Paenibacillus sp. LHD-38]
MKVKALFLLMIMGLFNSMLSGSATAQNIAPSESVAAPTGDETSLGPAGRFAKAILRNNLDEAQKYVEKDFVQIPEIRENSPISGIQLVSSPKEDVKILLAHFDDEVLEGERLAFIWELTIKGDRITKIRILFDGANPLVDEARLIREYQKRFKRHVLVPTEFPFEITHFNGYVDGNESLELVYRNKALNGFFRVKVFPIVVELERYKGKDDVYYQLKDGTKALGLDSNWDMNFDSKRTGCNIRLRLETRKC